MLSSTFYDSQVCNESNQNFSNDPLASNNFQKFTVGESEENTGEIVLKLFQAEQVFELNSLKNLIYYLGTSLSLMSKHYNKA